MSETGKDNTASRENYSREQVVNSIREARERTGFNNPDDLGADDPAVKMFNAWLDQENPYISSLPPKAAKHRWNLDKTMVYFDAGFDDDDEYLDELAGDSLVQDLDSAETDKDEQGMSDVLDRINDAISRVQAKIHLKQ